jgi:hypothetical protein
MSAGLAEFYVAIANRIEGAISECNTGYAVAVLSLLEPAVVIASA